jgi:DNA polymerase I-like protein with 3'-5' exonuclease and polymerase domains
MLLQDPVETEKYVIKITTDNKGQMIDRRETENLSDSLSEYLKACQNLANDIKNNQFDLKIEDNLKTIVTEYQNCK